MGSLLQLIAYGVEDLYFTHEPQITFFKSVFKRYTNFAKQPIALNIDPGFNKKTKTKIIIKCDLLSKPVLHVKLKKFKPNGNICFTKRLGFALIKNIEFEINGQIINKLSGDYLNTRYELMNKNKNYDKMLGYTSDFNNFERNECDIFVPIDFWFNDYASAFPIGAIKNQDVFINLETEKIENLVCREQCVNLDDIEIDFMEIIFDCIFIDDLEKSKYYSTSYLIENVTEYEIKCGSDNKNKIRLQLNNYSKELMWINKKFCENEIYLSVNNNYEEISSQHVKNSIVISEDKPKCGCWERVDIRCEKKFGEIMIYNYSDDTMWFNYNSLMYDNASLMNKIQASVVSDNNNLMIHIDHTNICYNDINIPIKHYTDTRISNNDVMVNMPNNYGYYLDSNANPIIYSKLEKGDIEIFKKRGYGFFNYLQPLLYYPCGPCDGVNIYPFCLHPNLWQPSGMYKFNGKVMLTLYGELNKVVVMSKGYNVLYISDGQANLLF